jgi:hypothetical protein
MRKILLIMMVALMALPVYELNAQRETGISYRSRNLFGAGMSLVSFRYGYTGSRDIGFPPVSGFMEIGLHDNFTAGPFLGYARYDYFYDGFAQTWDYSWSFTNGGVRGSLHVTRFLNNTLGFGINENRTDWYLTFILGIEYRQYSTRTTAFEDQYNNEFNFLWGPMAGVRYYLGNHLAFHFEAGRGNLGLFNFGLSLRL